MTMVMVLGMVLIGATEAIAQDRKEKPRQRPTVEQLMKDLDEDEDGKLSKEEVKGRLKEDFDKIDANEDGFLSEEELEKAPKPKRREN